ncbi:hypothetical protein O1611_g2870 [Lasiodiplodia mahajangana]|uniref:Uncharacterized protein n=1 Tax=Lasiodiplodia mahajangana TaxID=1108764 RepID=A0ACC2JTB8_9PEZI|nr:hypothetical protein O1611_g2870 [Lasiodiplodia mahajangana]
MLSSPMIKTLLMAVAAAAASVPVMAGDGALSRRVCYESETPALYCYTGNDDIPQDVATEDVTFIASYLRSYGRQISTGRLFVMKAADAPDCAEWLLYSRNTAAAYAKKINTTSDSAVLFEDIANTIDGGTGLVRRSGIYQCGTAGGSFGVQVNATAPAYNAPTYVSAGYVTDGVLVKIVANI